MDEGKSGKRSTIAYPLRLKKRPRVAREQRDCEPPLEMKVNFSVVDVSKHPPSSALGPLFDVHRDETAPRPVVWRGLSHQLDHPELSSERFATTTSFQQLEESSPNLAGGCVSVTDLNAAGAWHRSTWGLIAFLPLVVSSTLIH